MFETFQVETRARSQFVDITERVANVVHRSGLREGLCHVYVPHTTAGITIQENADPDVVRDLLDVLEQLVPRLGTYRHAEGNSDSHVKASLMGSSQTIPISGGQLAFGTWQGLYLCEFDGPRTRRVAVTLLRS